MQNKTLGRFLGEHLLVVDPVSYHFEDSIQDLLPHGVSVVTVRTVGDCQSALYDYQRLNLAVRLLLINAVTLDQEKLARQLSMIRLYCHDAEIAVVVRNESEWQNMPAGVRVFSVSGGWVEFVREIYNPKPVAVAAKTS